MKMSSAVRPYHSAFHPKAQINTCLAGLLACRLLKPFPFMVNSGLFFSR